MKWLDNQEHYCPCNGQCHEDKMPCSFACLGHHHLYIKKVKKYV